MTDPPSSSPLVSSLERLIQQWRNSADLNIVPEEDGAEIYYASGQNWAYRQCADELEALLESAVLREARGTGSPEKELHYALVKIRAHTSYVSPSLELLQGLLQSIERIADAALAAGGSRTGSDPQ